MAIIQQASFFSPSVFSFGGPAMKWILGYAVGTVLLVVPVGLRLLMRSEAAPQALDDVAVREGKMLFTHEWTVNDPLCPKGDGLGPVFNATSCAQCHFQGGLGGSGGPNHNVTTFLKLGAKLGQPLQGVIHASAIAPDFQESLVLANPELPGLIRPTLEQIRQAEEKLAAARCGAPQTSPIEISQRNTPALFGAKLIDDLPEQVILANERFQKLRWREASGQGEIVPAGRASRLQNGRLGKFGWKAQSPNLLDFVQAACANELGLGNPGQAQPTSLAQPNYQPQGLDLSAEQCEQMTAFIASLPRPIEKTPADARGRQRIDRGRQFFHATGCADCHVPNMGSLEGVYSDLLLHRMGNDLNGGGSYFSPSPGSLPSPGAEPLPDEWRTPPLWGVADSAPYLHDGRSPTLEDAILKHGGQAKESAARFQNLSAAHQEDMIHFLKSLRAPG
jgi:CxxC motif-containing protein (DUF1111 family)